MHVGSGYISLHKQRVEAANALADSAQPLDAAALAEIEATEAVGMELIEAGAAEGLDVLDAALRARQSRGDPLDPDAVQAAMQAAVARVQIDAEGALVRVRALDALLVARAGRDDRRRMEPLSLLVALLAEREEADEHLAAAEEQHRLAELLLDPDDTDRIALACALAEARFHRGDAEGAGGLWRRARADYERVLGPDADDVLDVDLNLAVVAKVTGDVAAALRTERRLLAVAEARDGKDSVAWLRVAHNLALSLFTAGDEEDGLALAEEVFERKLAVLGPFDDDTQLSGRFLSEIYEQRGDEAAGQAVVQRLIAALQGAMGEGEE